MKWNALVILCMLCAPGMGVNAQPVTHQRVFDTVPYIPEHHEKRLMIFRDEPMTTGGLIFLGNSITEGGDWSRLLSREDVLNRGIGGDITYGLLERLDDIIRRQPDKLFVMIGINDIGKDIPDAIIAENVRKLIRTVKEGSPQTTIIIQSILPVNPEYPGFPQHYDKQLHVLMTNQLLEKAAAMEDAVFLNLFPFFLDERQRLDQELTTDGLHLNDAGYLRWSEILKQSGLL